MTRYTVKTSQASEFLDLPEELPSRPAGHTGVRITGGRLGEEFEHNFEFRTPRRRALMVGKMLRTSPVLSLAEEYLTGLCTSVKLSIKRNDQTSEEAAVALEKWLGVGPYEDQGGRMGDTSTDGLIRHLMSARVYGHVAMSEAYHYDEEEGLYFISLHRRRQESYDAYVTEQGTERLLGIVQRSGYSSGASFGSKVLPLRETLWLVHRPDLGWYDGRSALRPVYAHWRSEQLRYRLEDLAANRYATRPVAGKLLVEKFISYANGASGEPPTRDQFVEEIASMQRKLENLHSSENSHLLYADHWEFSDRAAQHSYNPEPLLLSAGHHQRLMSEALYIGWILQGRTGSTGGSRAMLSVQQRVIDEAVVDMMQWIVNALNAQTVDRFMRANFSKLSRAEYPRVSFERSSIIRPWWQDNATAFASFVQSGILTMSPDDERAIRASSDLPEPPEDSPSVEDRVVAQAGGRLKTAQGQREANRPGDSAKKGNPFVNRLVARGLTEKQEKKLEKHADHHSPEHMDAMVEDMQDGATFEEAHKKAMEEVGE